MRYNQAAPWIHRIIRSYVPGRAKWYGVIPEKEDRASSWQAEFNPPYRLLLDPELEATRLFKIESSPAIVLIGADGRIVKEWQGYSGFWLKDLNSYMAKVNDENTRGVQAGMIGWYDVPRTASSLLELLRCVPSDLSFFCDERIDTRIERALEIQATDPDEAIALWTRIERDIVDLAPWVPLFTPSHAHLVSKRVGNYQFNPESRLLFDQLWVR